MKTHMIVGADGVKLNVYEAGETNQRSILFIHGFSQCGLAWTKQLDSALANEFRLVAMDIRGHGQSEKPRDAYADSVLWADDVRAVITTLELDRPVLCGWSYGGVILSDYLAQHGEEAVAGTVWIGAITRLGAPLVEAGFLDGDFLRLVPDLCAEGSQDAGPLQSFLRLCVDEEPSLKDLYFFLGYNALVPPHVRRDLLDRTLNSDSVVQGLRKPMLIIYGEHDRVVSPAMAKHIADLAPRAQVSAYEGVGHMPFWEAPERFNRELAASCAAAWGPI